MQMGGVQMKQNAMECTRSATSTKLNWFGTYLGQERAVGPTLHTSISGRARRPDLLEQSSILTTVFQVPSTVGDM